MSLAVLVLADDLTGALEIGALFAAQGVAACVRTDGVVEADTPVLVLDTETRHLSAGEASLVVAEIATRARADLIYKKTDSTLRGNIGAELRSLTDAFPERRVVFAPAYPALGRVVRGGHLYVDGVPVHQTAFAHDPRNPVRSSAVADVLDGLECTVLDGACEADTAAAAELVLASGSLAAGPGALARALAAGCALPRGEVPQPPRIERALVVNGSLHPASAAQVACARWSAGWRCFDAARFGADLAALGAGVAAEIAAVRPQALVVFGGDTAFAIHRAMGGGVFESIGEIIPGVPLSCTGELWWVTKAGGFGSDSILCDIQRLLT